MALTLIRTFLAIVETGSLVRASAMLNVTQSTVTTRLKTLEDDLGQRLLHRQKSGVQLTSSGVKFKRYAEAMDNMWRLARQETSLPPGMESICNLGCEIDLWPLAARRLASAVRERFPATALSIRPVDQRQIEDWLASSLIDAALCYVPVVADNIRSIEMGKEVLKLYTTDPEGPLIHNPEYVYVDAGDRFGREHAAAYADASVALSSFGSAGWAMDHILDHGGAAYLPDKMATPHVTAGTLHEVPEAPLFSRDVYLVCDAMSLAAWPWLPDLLRELRGGKPTA
ncbi:MAG: LysR family transcriptional regulator [Pseudomonadota bacterium]